MRMTPLETHHLPLQYQLQWSFGHYTKMSQVRKVIRQQVEISRKFTPLERKFQAEMGQLGTDRGSNLKYKRKNVYYVCFLTVATPRWVVYGPRGLFFGPSIFTTVSDVSGVFFPS